jgi:4-amino-4-deoxy-L-arabinose transferase-like glycosyltransferase
MEVKRLVILTSFCRLCKRFFWPVALVLALTFILRAWRAGQPIVENYVGRQIPTAMVARNLDRGSGFFRPQLDTAPFPNYFVVEPPLYQLIVIIAKRETGLSMDAAGRIVSALAMTLGALGLFFLVRTRSGDRAALLATLAFAVFPLTIRYGRAFQPDALMLGTVLAGLAGWDRAFLRGGRVWFVAGWCLLAFGIAVKIIAAFVLVPFWLSNPCARRPRNLAALTATVLPALGWYAWAYYLIETGAGSRASADNRAVWLHLAGPLALFKRETLEWVGWFLLVRAFTPLGTILAVAGFWRIRGGRDRLFWFWGLAALIVMALLAGKLHHEYYWLLFAPVVAFGVGAALDRLARDSWRVATVSGLVLLCVVQVRSTWRMPAEWMGLDRAAREVAAVVPPNELVASSEALLYAADRRGCRMEWTAGAARRAAGEWQAGEGVDDPVSLLAYYRDQGARYFADLGNSGGNPRRMALHDFVRRRYKVIIDRPEVIIADLATSEARPHAN